MIDWNAVVTTVLASSTITAIILAVLGFIARSIFTQFLSRDIEQFKSKRETELERFKSDLQKSAFEHQIRYQSLHGMRAEVIAELYTLLVQAEHNAVSLANPFQGAGEPPLVEKSKQAYQSGKALYDYFEKNRIYFEKESCERISNFIQGLYHSLIDFNFVLDELEHPHDAKERTKEWVKVWEKLTKELSPIKIEIEQEFREILGL
jgi:hypothetical protein